MKVAELPPMARHLRDGYSDQNRKHVSDILPYLNDLPLTRTYFLTIAYEFAILFITAK
jgi:hypothetical protein